MSKVLVVNDGKRERELLLVERLVVGRDPMCDLSHDDALLSRRHAEFSAEGEDVLVRDLGSRNGLFVNGTRAAERSLRPGDIVQIGPLRVRYLATEGTVSALEPDELDLGGTKVIPGPPLTPAPMPAATPPPAPLMQAAPRASITINDSAAGGAYDDDRDREEVTRVVQLPEELERSLAEADEAEATMMVTAEEIGSGVRSASASSSPAFNNAATLRVPTPQTGRQTVMIPPPGPAAYQRQAAAVSAALPADALNPLPPVDVLPPPVNAGLSGFVFVQLAALASVVFVASSAPLILWQGDGTPAGERTAANLLRWPVLPIVIALATTYVVATLVNRRMTETLIAMRNEMLAASDEPGPSGDYRL